MLSSPSHLLPCHSRAPAQFEALSVPAPAWPCETPKLRSTKVSHSRAHAPSGFFPLSLLRGAAQPAAPMAPTLRVLPLCHPRLHPRGKRVCSHPSTFPSWFLPTLSAIAFMSKQQKWGWSETIMGRMKLLQSCIWKVSTLPC